MNEKKLLDEMKKKLDEMGYTEQYLWEDPPGTFYDWHIHTENEIRAVIRGSMIVETENARYELKPGDILEIPANTRHRAQTSEGVLYLCGLKK